MSADFNIRDLDQLRGFHRQLTQFNLTMEQQLHQFRGELFEINGVWNDPMYYRLKDALEEAFHGIEAYLRVAPEPDAYLDGLVRELDEIRQRYGR